MNDIILAMIGLIAGMACLLGPVPMKFVGILVILAASIFMQISIGKGVD